MQAGTLWHLDALPSRYNKYPIPNIIRFNTNAETMLPHPDLTHHLITPIESIIASSQPYCQPR